MADVMTVKGVEGVINLNNKVKQIPKYIAKANYDFSRLVRNRLRKQLTMNGTRWKGDLWKSIEAKRVSKNRSVVKMALKGVYLDSMKPHYVSLKRGRKVTEWVKKHHPLTKTTGKSRYSVGPKGGIKGGALYVTPHPFIDDGFNSARKQFRGLLKEGLNNALRGA